LEPNGKFSIPDQETSPPKRRRALEIIKTILGFILPFVILVSFPIIFFYLLYNVPSLFGAGNIKPDNRQFFLEQNWERYLARGARWMDTDDVEGFELTLCPFKEDGNWKYLDSPEDAGFICGNVTVPLYHEQPDGEIIQIPIAIWPDYFTLPVQIPLFITHGGPGGSALEMYPRMFFTDRFPGQGDVVIVDQRGTQYAEPSLVCPEVTESSKEGIEDYQDYLRYCRARLTGKGVDLAAFATNEISRDFEVVWRTLGYSEINFYGVSYGSHVGQYLAAYYPENIRALVLDGIAPIPLDYLNRSLTTHNRILNELITNCEQDPICSEQYPDLKDKLNNSIEYLNQNPKKIRIHIPNSLYSFGDEIDGEGFYNYILSSAYLDNNYAALPYIIQQAEKNRFDSTVSFFEVYISRFLSTSGGFYSVICAEHSPMSGIYSDEPILSPSMMGWEIENQEEIQEKCLSWNVSRSPNVLDTMPESGVPVLLMSGFYDPVTPPEYGKIALQSFPHGQHIIDPFGSHGVAFNDDCTRGIVAEFLDAPADPVNSECLSDPERRSSPVHKSALSIPFLSRSENIADNSIFIPVLIFPVMILRYILKGIRKLWKRYKGTLNKRSPIEWKLHRRFELASWVFYCPVLVLELV